MNEVKKEPLWKNAIDVFIASNFSYGEAIPKSWFMNQFGIKEPVTAKDQESASLQFLASMDSFRRSLLTEYKIYLISLRSVGYAIVPPGSQTNVVMETGAKEIEKTFRDIASGLKNIKYEVLSESERTHNSDQIAKLSFIKSHVNRRVLLGRKSKSE